MILTDNEISDIYEQPSKTPREFARSIEQAVIAKLREQEPVAWMYQHEDTGLVGFIDQYQLDNGFEKLNPRLQVTRPLFEHPAPIPADWRPIIANFIHQFKRHVGGDGEFWLHELEDFYTNMAAARN